jgi:hypothetical protein
MHVIPNDEWYDRAKKATDRCDLELTKQVTGAKNGLADKVVWVSGLLDLKRGEAGAFSRCCCCCCCCLLLLRPLWRLEAQQLQC